MESIKSGVAPDVNALSALILIGTILLAVIPQSGILSKRKQ
jgi:spermidine/putrescine transport system permease protein